VDKTEEIIIEWCDSWHMKMIEGKNEGKENLKALLHPPSRMWTDLLQWEWLSWSCTLREGHKLQVFENKVLRKMFRP
jgi:hypothetical protein